MSYVFCLEADILRQYSHIQCAGPVEQSLAAYPSVLYGGNDPKSLKPAAMSEEGGHEKKVAKAGRPLNMTDRLKLLALYQKGYKISHIARIVGVTHSCISKIISRYRRTGSICPRSARVSESGKSDSELSDGSSQTSSEVEDPERREPLRPPPLPYSIERLLA